MITKRKRNFWFLNFYRTKEWIRMLVNSLELIERKKNEDNKLLIQITLTFDICNIRTRSEKKDHFYWLARNSNNVKWIENSCSDTVRKFRIYTAFSSSFALSAIVIENVSLLSFPQWISHEIRSELTCRNSSSWIISHILFTLIEIHHYLFQSRDEMIFIRRSNRILKNQRTVKFNWFIEYCLTASIQMMRSFLV